jgi:hypothetical protein
MRSRRILHLALSLSLTALAGCGPLIEGLRNAEQRIVTLEPLKTGSRIVTDWTNFGICHVRLEQRVVGSRSMFVFTNFEPPQDALAGFEVRIARGESCHYRETHRFQAAVMFDLSSLPSGAITRAELEASTLVHAGVDPPINFGSREVCPVLELQRATAEWDAGLGRSALIAGTGVRPARDGFSSTNTFEVTRTVQEWQNGRRPNLGFLITPHADDVARHAGRIEEVRDQFMCPVMYSNFRLEVSMLVPGT